MGTNSCTLSSVHTKPRKIHVPATDLVTRQTLWASVKNDEQVKYKGESVLLTAVELASWCAHAYADTARPMTID